VKIEMASIHDVLDRLHAAN
jgi:hypothetical protein